MTSMPKHSVLRSVAVVSGCTAASRVLGFVREVLMAVFFGTTLAKSAFDVAFKIPNLFRRLFGEGALSAAFIPVFSESLQKEGREAAGRLAGRIMTMLGLTLALIVVGGILVVSGCLKWASLGHRATAVLPLLRIMLPYMFFICLVALCMGILNSFHHFAVPAFTPVFLNVVWILIMLFLCPRFGVTPAEQIYGVAWGILAAGLLQLLLQVPALIRFGFRPRLSMDWRDPRVVKVLALMGPAALGMGVTQINVVIDGVLALAVGDWAPAALTYAERLIYLPLGVFGTAMATVLLPTFSHQAANARPDQVRATMAEALGSLMLVMIPATIGLLVLARPVVELAFVWKGGMFGAQSTLRTMRAVCFYAPGLVVFSLYKVFVPAFYAMHDTRTPVRVGVWVVGLNLALNILFVVTWPQEYKHAGLAFATVLSSGVSVAVLACILQRRSGSPGWWPVATIAARALIGALVMGWMVRLLHSRVATLVAVYGVGDKASQIVSVVGSILSGIMLYTALMLVLCPSQTRRLLRLR